jgi:hypothetical protein
MPFVDRVMDRDIGGELAPAAIIVDCVAESKAGSDHVLRVCDSDMVTLLPLLVLLLSLLE